MSHCLNKMSVSYPKFRVMLVIELLQRLLDPTKGEWSTGVVGLRPIKAPVSTYGYR